MPDAEHFAAYARVQIRFTESKASLMTVDWMFDFVTTVGLGRNAPTVEPEARGTLALDFLTSPSASSTASCAALIASGFIGEYSVMCCVPSNRFWMAEKDAPRPVRASEVASTPAVLVAVSTPAARPSLAAYT